MYRLAGVVFAFAIFTSSPALSKDVTDDDVEEGIEHMDKNADGKVSLEELHATMEPPSEASVTEEMKADIAKYRKLAEEQFPIADKDGDGNLDKDEFKKIMQFFTEYAEN